MDASLPLAFRSICSQGFCRVAACTPVVAIADPATNAERTIGLARAAAERHAMLAVFPELGLSAYTATDHMAGDVFGFEAGGEHGSYAESVDGTAVRALRVTNGSQPAGALLMLAVKSLARTQNHLMVLGRRNANERMAALLLDLGERHRWTAPPG